MADIHRAVSIMEEFLNAYMTLGDPRHHAYARVIAGLKKAKSLEDYLARDQDGVGPSMRKKLIAIQRGQSIPKLARLRKLSAGLAILQTILGVGAETSREWAHLGAYDIASARKLVTDGVIKPTHMQKIGLDHYEDLHTRIPRDEVRAVGDFIGKYLPKCAKYELVGSYRRGAADSGDVDILARCDVYPQNINIPGAIMLTEGPDRVSFIVNCVKTWRQVDILFASDSAYPFSLLYFTGSYDFNIAMRRRARDLGYTLNQTELVGWKGKIKTEKDIFDALGLKYVEPRDRTDADAVTKL